MCEDEEAVWTGAKNDKEFLTITIQGESIINEWFKQK